MEKEGLEWEGKEKFINGFYDLLSDTTIKLSKEDYYIELAYDTKIRTHIASLKESHFEANKNDTPDIRLAAYKSDGELIAGLIVEVKYRKHRYIYDKKDPTDVLKQIVDYTKIQYFDMVRGNKGKKIHVKDPIKQVITVYPKQDKGEPFEYIESHKYGQELVLIQLTPTTNSDKPFGYGYLQELISNFLINLNKYNS